MLRDKLDNLRKKLASLFRVKGSPYFVAFGAAVGLFWNFIPSLGIGPILSLLAARFFKARSVAAVTVNLATGFFIPLFYTLNVVTGKLVTGLGISLLELKGIESSLEKSVGNIAKVADEPQTYFFLDRLQSFSKEFLIGSAVNAFLAAIAAYLVVYLVLSRRKKYLRLRPRKGQSEKDGELSSTHTEVKEN